MPIVVLFILIKIIFNPVSEKLYPVSLEKDPFKFQEEGDYNNNITFYADFIKVFPSLVFPLK
jgi:hypothetical protein